MAVTEIILKSALGGPIEGQVPLSGTLFSYRLKFNARVKYWTLDFMDAAFNPIQMGIRGTVNFPLLIRCTSPKKPPGQLYLMDTSGEGIDPGPYDLGNRVRFVYDDAPPELTANG